jgi:hypothetical protein
VISGASRLFWRHALHGVLIVNFSDYLQVIVFFDVPLILLSDPVFCLAENTMKGNP